MEPQRRMDHPQRGKGAQPAPPFQLRDTRKWAGWQWKQAGRAFVCMQALQDVGFGGDLLREMTATWLAESGGKRLASNVNANGTTDLGPAQINQPLIVGGIDRRTEWHAAAAETRRLFDLRGFTPWYAHGGANFLALFPYVDVAATWMDAADRDRHGFRITS